MAKGNGKTYTLRGKVTKVYEPREVVMNYGGKKVVKNVSDLYLQLDAGAKVKLSFWDIDVSHHEGSVVCVSALTYGGKYKDVPQYSSTKETKISVTKKGALQPPDEPADATPEGATLEEEPTFGGDGAPEEEAPEGAVEEVTEAEVPEETPVETPAPVKAKPAAKPAVVAKPKVAAKPVAAKPVAAKPTAAAYVVPARVIEVITAEAHAAADLAELVASDLVKTDPQAMQALFATLFISIGKAR